MTGITDAALLRASHIVPWVVCRDDAQRLDAYGLLLSALWDAAFDPGLVSFANDGAVLTALVCHRLLRDRLRLKRCDSCLVFNRHIGLISDMIVYAQD